MAMTLVLALDIATRTGWARGRVGDKVPSRARSGSATDRPTRTSSAALPSHGFPICLNHSHDQTS
jgi:hypothetical protein